MEMDHQHKAISEIIQTTDYEYIGCFIPRDELLSRIAGIERSPLASPVLNTHITVAYQPDQVNKKLFGTIIDFVVDGYGNDGENEGLLVHLSSKNEELNEMIRRIPRPHITLTVSKTGEAVNTRFLDFHPVYPVKMSGIFGGCAYTGTIVLEP